MGLVWACRPQPWPLGRGDWPGPVWLLALGSQGCGSWKGALLMEKVEQAQETPEKWEWVGAAGLMLRESLLPCLAFQVPGGQE